MRNKIQNDDDGKTAEDPRAQWSREAAAGKSGALCISSPALHRAAELHRRVGSSGAQGSCPSGELETQSSSMQELPDPVSSGCFHLVFIFSKATIKLKSGLASEKEGL